MNYNFNPLFATVPEPLSKDSILRLGCYREDYNGQSPDIVFLCFKVNLTKDYEIELVTIVTNPFLKMAKQEKGLRYYFLAVHIDLAQTLANDSIIKFNTGQRLFNAMTIRQAMYRIHRENPSFKKSELAERIQTYNEIHGKGEHLYTYCGIVWINKDVVQMIVDCENYENWRRENER